MDHSTDATLLETSLTTLAERNVDIRHKLYERFFDAFPDRRPVFYNVETSSQRMTDETLQMMYGLAAGESWVWPLVAELVFTHRNYGTLPQEEYDAFIDMVVDEVAAAQPDCWTDEMGAAWARQATALKALISGAREQWADVMPGGPPLSAAP